MDYQTLPERAKQRRTASGNKTRTRTRKNKKMAKINDVFGGGFLKAEDLKGASPTVKISRVEVKDFDDGNKLIVHFEGKDKALVCNKTNSSIIAEVLGSDDTDDWEGKRIVLTVKKVEFQGKLVPAIRVSLDPPKSTQAQRPPPPPPVDDETNAEELDDIPF